MIKIKNPRIVVFSLLALACIVLTFAVSWMFLIGAVILMLLNQRELMKNNLNKINRN
ncbi:MAG: hypothetical protein M1165_02665 [Candidatus Pacearchaeota archaeon]|nr:hypothetical protein [Candidatus Pacearchaeota archaeon]MDE1848554.1 hypothetical protein [Nanoarchaeota archaeon]